MLYLQYLRAYRYICCVFLLYASSHVHRIQNIYSGPPRHSLALVAVCIASVSIISRRAVQENHFWPLSGPKKKKPLLVWGGVSSEVGLVLVKLNSLQVGNFSGEPG